jgi:hypothetical protein
LPILSDPLLGRTDGTTDDSQAFSEDAGGKNKLDWA